MQREEPRDFPPIPARSKPSASAKRATLGDIPIMVKPTKQQIAASKEEQQNAKYLLGLKGKTNPRMTSGASNHFKALEDTAHIEEVDQPDKEKKPEEPPAAEERLASVESDLYADPSTTFIATTTDSAVPVADFLRRESFV
jgi:hypothetical protein